MHVFLIFSLMLPLLLGAEPLKEVLMLCLDADSKAPAGVSIPSTTRLRAGKFGKGYLIERRTRNEFKASDVMLSDGAALKGSSNILTLPAGTVAALPLTAIRPGSYCTLSFTYKGSGRIIVSWNRKEVKSFTAGPEKQYGVAVIKNGDTDVATLRIKAEKGAVLEEVLFDRGINYPCTYIRPGTVRSCDWIKIDPAKYYNMQQGAFSCWIKTPWLVRGFKNLSGAGLLCLLWKTERGKLFTDNIVRSITFWDTGYCDSFYGEQRTTGGARCRFNELKLFPADGWHHVVFNWKIADGKLHSSIIANGNQVFNRTSNFIARPKPVSFTVGYTGGAYLDGVIDDIALFRRPLTVQEAEKIFKANKPLSQLVK